MVYWDDNPLILTIDPITSNGTSGRKGFNAKDTCESSGARFQGRNAMPCGTFVTCETEREGKTNSGWGFNGFWRGKKGAKYMGVSKNIGTPKSSILIGFSIINNPFWGIPIFGNTHYIWI